MFLPSHFLEAIPKAMANEVGKRDQRNQPWWVGGRDFPKEMGLGWILQRIWGPHGSLDLGPIFVWMPRDGCGKILSHPLQLPFLCRAGSQLPVSSIPSMCSSDSFPQVLMCFLSIWQDEFGKSVTDCTNNFCLFQSSSKDLLFRDDTKCLASIAKKTYDSYLGEDYVRAMTNLRQCSTSSE